MQLDPLVLAAAALAASLLSAYLGVLAWRRASRISAVARALLGSRAFKLARPRKRYMVFEVVTVSGDLSSIRRASVEEAVRKSCQLLFGALGYGAVRPTLIYYDESRGAGILAFRHLWRNHVFLLLSLIRDINGVKVVVVPVLTTGTRRKAMKALERL